MLGARKQMIAVLTSTHLHYFDLFLFCFVFLNNKAAGHQLHQIKLKYKQASKAGCNRILHRDVDTDMEKNLQAQLTSASKLNWLFVLAMLYMEQSTSHISNYWGNVLVVSHSSKMDLDFEVNLFGQFLTSSIYNLLSLKHFIGFLSQKEEKKSTSFFFSWFNN